nr:hypothetical protein [Tanacetum cinerariifolium]
MSCWFYDINESIPEADIPLWKRARFTTPTGGYEIGESSVAAARQIRPTLTIAESHKADDRLTGRLRRERRYFCTLSTTYAQEVSHSHDDADDNGDDLSEDDADDEDEEESSDSEEEEDEHLALTVPTPALHSSIPASEDSNKTEPFEEGETAAPPPPFRYRVAAKIFVQPHILMPFRSESE